MRICEVCGEEAEIEIDWPLLDGSGGFEKRLMPRQCKCKREEEEKRKAWDRQNEIECNLAKIQSVSLVDEKSRKIFFADLNVTEDNSKIISIAKKYVDNFDTMMKKSQGLLFYGSVGTGKSHIAAAICNELIHRFHPVVMTSFIRCIDKYDEIAAVMNSADLLIIDDLGTERSTDYALEKIYDMIDRRYRSMKPVIITTNIDFSEMKNCSDIRYQRLYDRIFEMCFPVKFSGMSWRKTGAANRYKEMKELLEA